MKSGQHRAIRQEVSAVFLPHFFRLKNEKYIQYSFVFQTLNWGKNPVWDFLPNCAVLPYFSRFRRNSTAFFR